MNFDNTMPDWENAGVEPSADLKKSGFQAGYKPPAGIFNYLWSTVTKVCKELQAKLKSHAEDKGNPHGVTAAQVGLDKVDNTPDNEKSVNVANFASEAGVGRRVENDLIIRFNGGSTENTNLFTYNGSGGKSVNITPDKLGAAKSDLSNVTAQTIKEKVEGVIETGTPIVVATSTDGVNYSATVDGLTELYNGLEITIVPNMTSTSTTLKLDVNGLGAKNMRMSINGYNFGNSGTIAALAGWLGENCPVTFQYREKFDNWQSVVGRPSVTGLYGTLKVTQGGTGADNAEEALDNLGTIKVYNSFAELNLTVGSETIESIVTAMRNRSMLMCSIGTTNAAIYPHTTPYGTLEVVKISADRCTLQYTDKSSGDTWVGCYSSTNADGKYWTGWNKLATATHNHASSVISYSYTNDGYNITNVEDALDTLFGAVRSILQG